MNNFLQRISKRINNIIQYPELIPTLFNKVNRGFCHDLLFLKKEMDYNFSTIIDVGAAIGSYTKAASFVFPNAKVYAFEPIPEIFKKLKKDTQNNNTTCFNVALSNEIGEAEFNLNDFSFSSSLLKMTETHKEVFPFTKNETKINVITNRLDNYVGSNEIPIYGKVLLKMDVQGTELKVLQGAQNSLNKFNVIYLEVSFMPFYEGQATIEEIISFLKPFGFNSFKQTEPIIKDYQLLYSDFIFIKS